MKTEPTESLSIKRANIVDKYLPAGDEQRYYERLKMHEELFDLINSHSPKIKQLEWVFFDLYYEAETSVGCYTIFRIGVGKSNHEKCELMYNNRELSSHDSIESAMARAQIDFEKRVKECFE